MGITIKEIAEMAGVSRGTVDRALNGRPGISADIKDKILKVAADHEYHSNKAGRMLSFHKSLPKIGIQIPSIGNDFFIDVQAGLERAAKELSDYKISLDIKTMKGYDFQEQIRQIRELVNEGINALAFVPINHNAVRDLLRELAAKGLPVITVNMDLIAGERLCYVGNDYQKSGSTTAGLMRLLSAGWPMQVLIMTGSFHMLGHNQRIAGFTQIIKNSCPNIKIVDVIENQDDEQFAYERTLEALSRFPELNAIYMAAGSVAGACRAIKEAGLKQQITVICNDLTASERHLLENGTITATIDQQAFNQGYRSVMVLFSYLVDGKKPPDQLVMSNEIFIKENIGFKDTAN